MNCLSKKKKTPGRLPGGAWRGDFAIPSLSGQRCQQRGTYRVFHPDGSSPSLQSSAGINNTRCMTSLGGNTIGGEWRHEKDKNADALSLPHFIKYKGHWVKKTIRRVAT